MTDNLSSPSTLPNKKDEARGLFGFVKALGAATEQLFRRSYERPDSHAENKQGQDAVESREAEIAHLHTVLENISEGVIMQDVDGRIMMINEAALKLLGSQKAFWDSDLARLYTSANVQVDDPAEIELVGEPTRIEINDRILAANVAAVADQSGTPMGTVIVLQDMTRNALADRLKDDFVTQVSHELRTPLTTIKGMSDVLLALPADRPPNRRFLETISRNVDVLDRMIIELLDISEISSGEFAIRQEDITLDDLIWSVIRGHQTEWERAKLEVHVFSAQQSKTQVIGDQQRLRWALGHILENAINYTEKGGIITFRIGEFLDHYALIRIEDSGVGISDYDLSHVSERFYRGEARTREGKLIDPRGLGQGLFIVQAVAEAHEGFVTIDSKVGEGTIVTLAAPQDGLKDGYPTNK